MAPLLNHIGPLVAIRYATQLFNLSVKLLQIAGTWKGSTLYNNGIGWQQLEKRHRDLNHIAQVHRSLCFKLHRPSLVPYWATVPISQNVALRTPTGIHLMSHRDHLHPETIVLRNHLG